MSVDIKAYRKWLRGWNVSATIHGAVSYFVKYRREDGSVCCLTTERNFYGTKALLTDPGGNVVASSVTRIRLYLRGLDVVEWGELR